MTKRIIIHCGFPKTGSSALQVQLAQSRSALLEHGFDYIRMGDFALGQQGRIGSGNGTGLAWAFLPPQHEASQADRRGAILENFLGQIRSAQGHVLLSSEFFAAIPVKLLTEMIGALSAEGEVELVYFLREQMSLMASTYMQRVKRHGLTDFPETYFENWDHFKPALMYNEILTKVREACPGVRLHVQPYERSRDHPGGLIGLFLGMIGAEVPRDRLAPDLPINLSPSPMELRLMLEVNKHHPRMQFSDMLVEGSVRAGRARLHADHSIVPPAARAEIQEFFREGNEACFRDFMGTDNEYAPPEGPQRYDDLREITFAVEDVVHVVTGLLSDIDKRLAKVEAKTATLGT